MRPRDEFDECESVASKIKELVIGGAKYSEIAVIVRNLATYRGIIDYILEKYDVPFYMSDSTVISSKPLIKLLFSAVRACASWSARDITSFIRSGYSQISDEDCDELESYMFRWDISGRKFESDDYWSANPDGYVISPTITQMERLSKINDTRSRVLELLMPLRKAFAREATTLELCTELYSLLKALDIKSQIKAQIEISDESEAMELSQLYSAIMDALDTMCQILPSEKIGEEMFLTSLSHALEGVRIGTIPTGEDNVTVGEALSLRTENI
jgi:ATP-dependent helicase/nuclease subunit B